MADSAAGTAPPVAAVALRGLCPRCGSRSLFAGLVQLAERCRACALDFTPYEGSDRFAAILNLLVAAGLIWAAVTIERSFQPPLLLQALVWAPLTAGMTVFLLRFMRARGVATRYRRAVV